MMATLHAPPTDLSATKWKAIDDARRVYASIVKECRGAGRDPPPYTPRELIGKGSFGRVYKASSDETGQLVAVKIIDIEESDRVDPGANDAFNDILKEVNTLKLLNRNGAKNINTILDTFLIGQSIWMVTEYCAGGSVTTLMRPTKGLPEQWIIPILREVAEALSWVHRQGIIHRDIKCANVLLTENGGVQLCDFGVAALMETKFDKRRTVTGSLHWMAPEFFEPTVSYGIEVDIWAFGSMAFEMASGLPPNARPIVDINPNTFGSYLKQHCPRLEGNQYSLGLKDLISFCMVENPTYRPAVGNVQRHPYIFNTEAAYPTESLSKLVRAYQLWESRGGTRQSLFSAGGAQGYYNAGEAAGRDAEIPNEEWDFGTEHNGNQFNLDDPDVLTVTEVYGLDISRTAQSSRPQPRRRRPPPSAREVIAPLAKVFDPNTITNYQDNARAFYGKEVLLPAPDLPLRNDLEQPTVRESIIDLDAALDGNRLSQFVDLETIKVSTRSSSTDQVHIDKHRTQDWTFPLMAPASADPENRPSRFVDLETIKASTRSFSSEGVHTDKRRTQDWTFPSMDSASAGPDVQPSGNSNEQTSRISTVSLIDLDQGLEQTRPATATSDYISTTSDVEEAPFGLEADASGTAYFVPSRREPSLYVSVDSDTDSEALSFISESEKEAPIYKSHIPEPSPLPDNTPPVRNDIPPGLRAHDGPEPETGKLPALALPPLQKPPSAHVMEGFGSYTEVKDELRRLISSFEEHLLAVRDVMETLPVRHSRIDAALEKQI
ncbi:kinase-like domain-containing protein [Nemania sp. FL0031]|nr:kinase-like domain-containing protein [Nemania sp. FL0031]